MQIPLDECRKMSNILLCHKGGIMDGLQPLYGYFLECIVVS
jgi:hypothetical protein